MWLEVVLGIIFLWVLWQACKKPQGLPPGLWGLPLVGHLSYPLILNEDKVKSMREKYGDIFVIRIGTFINVFLCRYDLCKEACSKMEFTDRPLWKLMNMMSKEGEVHGVLGSNGLAWQNGRRFALRHLRALGMGRTSMTGAIQLEAREMIKYFETVNGQLTELNEFMNQAVLNVIWQLVANRRYDVHDQEMLRFHKLVHDTQDTMSRFSIKDFFPWISKILPFWLEKKLCAYEKLHDLQSQLGKYFQVYIDEHKATLDPTSPRDYIDAYLIEMDKRKDDPDNTFSDEDLLSSIWDFFGAGNETVSYTLRWFLLHMAKYPEVQKKMQMEIDTAIPRHQQPAWEDKDKMPYTQATIYEILRITSLANVGIPHCASRDTMFSGYKIPKGTILYPVAFCSHNDDTYWNKPLEFCPERFLDGGKLVIPRDGFMPFGVGRRQCLGESLARMEVFIFCASLLQKLSFSPGPQGVTLLPRDVPLLNLSRPQMIKVDIRKQMNA